LGNLVGGGGAGGYGMSNPIDNPRGSNLDYQATEAQEL